MRNRLYGYNSKLNRLHNNPIDSQTNELINGTEPKHDREEIQTKEKNKRCVWSIPTRPYPGAHFAVFPEALVETPIMAGCPEQGIVLDPFCGSGTTLAVSKRLGRNFIGFEINPAYVKLAQDRVNQVCTESTPA